MAANDLRLQQLLVAVNRGTVSPEAALEQLRDLPYENLGFARIDHHRALRHSLPEVVYGRGKTVEQVVAIVQRIADRSDRCLVTQVPDQYYQAVRAVLPDAVYHPVARAITYCRQPEPLLPGVVLLTGGTADLPVAEEAAVTAELMGHAVVSHCDVGVAGIHRVLDLLPDLRSANVIIAVAGMEGALPSVVGGLVDVPVVALPTSVGYGANLGGMTPLLAMLNSCAPGLAVVNIDNGFGAGYYAALINGLAHRGVPADG